LPLLAGRTSTVPSIVNAMSPDRRSSSSRGSVRLTEGDRGDPVAEVDRRSRRRAARVADRTTGRAAHSLDSGADLG
jgi:hypothetical protein